jgi:PEP-CTERM motif
MSESRLTLLIRMKHLLLPALVMSLFAVAPAKSANIVVNGGFESATFAPWVVNDSTWFITTGGFGIVPHSGAHFAQTGCVGGGCIFPAATGAFLYQDLATTVGQTYDLTFFYAPNFGSVAELQVLWGDAGTPLVGSPGGTCSAGTNCVFDTTSNVGGTSYNMETVSGLLATSALTRLEFLGRQDPTFNGLDDVSVVGTGSAVPEPATILLGGAGLVGAFLRRKRTVRA